MKIADGKQAKLAGFALSWWLLVQTMCTAFRPSTRLGRTHFFSYELPLADWALGVLAWSLPVGAVAALVMLAIGKPSLLRDGARGFVSGLFSMLAVPAVMIAVIAFISLLWTVASSLMG